MDNRYRVIITNKIIYKEIELLSDMESVRIGTTKQCNLRLSKELFFEDIELQLIKVNHRWNLICSNNVFISSDGVKKLVSIPLTHGDDLLIKYQKSNKEIFKLSFMVDFQIEKNQFNREIDLTEYNRLTIGGRGSNLVILDPLIGEDRFLLQRVQENYVLYDYGSKYGVYVNGNRIKEQYTLFDYDFISILGSCFYYKYRKLYISSGGDIHLQQVNSIQHNISEGNHRYPQFNRSTRILKILPKEPIEILDPPIQAQKPKNNIATSLLPALGTLALTIVLRGIMGNGGSFVIFSVCTITLGIITSIFTFINGKKGYKKEVRQRKVKYESYINKKRTDIEEAREEEKELLNGIYYTVSQECKMVDEFQENLFERNPQDDDFLHIRIGTGDVKANQPIQYKKQEKLEIDDDLSSIPETVFQEFEYIKEGPIVCSLKDMNAIGIVGEEKPLYEFMKNTIIDLCVRQYHSDVNLFLILDDITGNLVHWSRFLPHLYNNDLDIRNIVCDDESRTILYEYLYKELSGRETSKVQVPHCVVFVYGKTEFKKHPISKYIKTASSYGFTFLFFEERSDQLPMGCNKLILLEKEETKGSMVDSSDSNCVENFIYPTIEDKEAQNIAIRLAPVYSEEISLESTLTKSITLYELLEIIDVGDLDLKQRWNHSVVYKSMAAPLGVNARQEIVSLDIHEKAHGPHGLVAGTTGSGKSEILQSYILSMATLYSPEEVAFMIIDFKGGGMVNQFRNLPHLVGAITNIDGREIDRSLKSIKAELQKRQRYFAEAQVNHVDAYIKKYKNNEVDIGIPHLIIIVDEFAELKAEQPEFMKELISAARIGRSLGVHLILATQKPAGQVNEQIWSNSKFKLCLKVQTKEDSNEVIKSPLAAEIKEPGRSYIQVGNNEIFELFQSAYSGGQAKEDDLNNKKEFYIASVGISGRRKVTYQQKNKKDKENKATQLDEIVSYVNDYCNNHQLKRPNSICLPPLPELIVYEEQREPDVEFLNVTIGIYDNPGQQYQGEAKLNVSMNNTIILGSPQYGKTNLLQCIIRDMAWRYSPKEVTLYIIDFASMILKNFEALYHCGGVVCSYEDEKLKNLFKLINSEMTLRKEKIMSVGVSSFSSYLEAGYDDIPQIILMIDNLTGLRELYLQDNDALVKICREGLAVGISVIATNTQTAGIGYKYLSNFSNKIALYCNDSSEYNNLFDSCKQKPLTLPGRCILEMDRVIYECQTYLAFEGDKEIERVNQMKEFINATNQKYRNDRARLIPEIPKLLTDKYIEKKFSYNMKPYELVIGLDYNSVLPITIDLKNMGVLSLTGRDGLGKGNFIKVIYHYLLKQGEPVEVAILDDVTKKFATLKEQKITSTYSLVPDKIKEILAQWEKKLEERYQAFMAGNESILDQEPFLLLIVQNIDVISAISTDKESFAIYKQIITKYKALKVAIIYSFIPNTLIPYNGPEVLKMIKEAKNYLVFDDIHNFKITDLPLASIRDYKKPVEPGDAYYVKENSITKIKTILNTDS